MPIGGGMGTSGGGAGTAAVAVGSDCAPIGALFSEWTDVVTLAQNAVSTTAPLNAQGPLTFLVDAAYAGGNTRVTGKLRDGTNGSVDYATSGAGGTRVTRTDVFIGTVTITNLAPSGDGSKFVHLQYDKKLACPHAPVTAILAVTDASFSAIESISATDLTNGLVTIGTAIEAKVYHIHYVAEHTHTIT